MIAQQPLLDEDPHLYPFQSDIQAGESGQGYALRMSSENGIGGLVRVKQMLGKTRFCTLDANDAPQIAQWFGGRVEQVEFALERRRGDRRVNGISYMGHALGRSYFLNRFYPRVCPDCLLEQPHCRAAWDFSLSVACAVHGRLLIDCCPACSHALNWHRPRVDVCECGYPWAAVDAPVKPTSWELMLARFVEGKLEGSRDSPSGGALNCTGEDAAERRLTSLMSGLSLDGILRMTHALATAHGYTPQAQEKKRVRGAMEKARQTAAWARTIGVRLARGDPVSLTQRPSVLLDLLGEVAPVRDSTYSDSSSAQSLLETLLTHSCASRWTSKHASLSQMVLF